jgi:2-polyprenyl-3-methyl-5-hydroxy-6-metoxy-1,4-benzoquinol methylase
LEGKLLDNSFEKTRESQYQVMLEVVKVHGLEKLGLSANESWYEDPKHLLFRLARYKFVSKMFSGLDSVLDVGCGDAFGARIVQAEVKSLTGFDFDPVFIEDAKSRMLPKWDFPVFVHDLLDGPPPGKYDGLYSLDVLEHIPQEHEEKFLSNAFSTLNSHGIALIGTPSKESQTYASVQSKAGHINCKTSDELKTLMKQYFHNVFIFSMNDEVIHTGFSKMAHYLFALGTSRK